MSFLFSKLWFIPLLKFFLRKSLRPTQWLFRLVFNKDEKTIEEDISSKVIHLERELNILKQRLQENNEILQTFIRHHVSIDGEQQDKFSSYF
ncbi:hypothetical protein I4U23_005248 [Adineta vaga]|nr:hypothetical protein I4U23_005248 [Adineta vaga]